MMTPSMIGAWVQPEVFLATIDLSDAYLLLSRCTKINALVSQIRSRRQIFEFRVLPLELPSSFGLFTVCVKAVLAYLQKDCVRLAAYTDDLLLRDVQEWR